MTAKETESTRLVLFTEGEKGPACGLDEEMIRCAGGAVRYERAADTAHRARMSEQAEVIIFAGAQMNRDLFTAAPQLKAIVRLGIGLDAVDIDAATDLGVIVANVPDFCTDEVPEHALGLIFAVTRKIAIADRKARAGHWIPGIEVVMQPMRRLRGQTLGLIGFGSLGRSMARKAKGLGLKVIAYDPYASPASAKAAGVPFLSLEELLPQTDILSLHVPLTPGTKHIINARTLALLKPGAILINTARGPVVDESSLHAALASGRLLGAGLDVLEEEPIRLPHPLTEFENVVFTCHYASLSTEAYANLRQQVSKQIIQVLRGKFPQHFVNPQVQDLPQCRLLSVGAGRRAV